MITDRRKFTTKITHYVIVSFHFYHWNQFKDVLWTVGFVQEISPNFLRRPTQVDNMADNADITQSQAANHHRLVSHVTLGLLECRKQTACAMIAELFEPNTVLRAFHTIQPSSLMLVFRACKCKCYICCISVSFIGLFVHLFVTFMLCTRTRRTSFLNRG